MLKKSGYSKRKRHETTTSIRYRQAPPSQFKKKSFRTKKVNAKTSLVLGKKKGSNKMSLQSVIKKK